MFNWFKKEKKDEEKYNQTLESQNTAEALSEEDELDESEMSEEMNQTFENFENIDENNAADSEPARLLDRLKIGLSKTRKDMSNKIEDIISGYKGVDDELFDDLEDVLVSADVGVNPTMMIINRLRERVKEERVSDPKEVTSLLKDEIKKLMLESVPDNQLNLLPHPSVLLVVGVNGVGKTTTIGKLAYGFKQNGKKVLIAAGDTFRAAAIEQLEEWSNRAGAEIISHTEGSDPAAVIFDGIQAAKARKADILICDTAGRLHNKSNLMNELNKIFRIVEREYGEATKEVILVLDATTGQNAINQAKVFKEVANITGVALTKLDGTAKGGVAIALQTELKLPIKIIGVGEKVEDLQPFDADSFIDAIFE